MKKFICPHCHSNRSTFEFRVDIRPFFVFEGDDKPGFMVEQVDEILKDYVYDMPNAKRLENDGEAILSCESCGEEFYPLIQTYRDDKHRARATVINFFETRLERDIARKKLDLLEKLK